MTVYEIIYNYIKEKLILNDEIFLNNVQIENSIREFGKERYGITHTAETYVRGFRDVRQNKRFKDLEIIEQSLPKSKLKYFKIKRLKDEL